MTKKTVTQKVLHQLKNVELCFLPVDMRPRDLGTNLLRSAILIYLACRARESKVNDASSEGWPRSPSKEKGVWD